MTTWCFDLDGTICTQKPDNKERPYNDARPYPQVVKRINQLFDKGDYIKIFTARGSTTGIDWREFTAEQLKAWGVKHHELILGKPEADWYVDDKAFNIRAEIWGDKYDHR